jgi:hypothetical protein
MTSKFLLSQSEAKNLYVQFGAVASVFSECVAVGKQAILTCLISHPKAIAIGTDLTKI